MRCRFALTMLLLAALVLPAAADPRPDILYTTRREFVRVSPPRQLTLNADIYQFAYDPLGLEVACIGAESPNGQVNYFVKTLDVRTGHELHRLTISATAGANAGFKFLGWTPSGKFLLLERTQPKDDGSGESVTDLVRWDLSADPPKVRPVEARFMLPKGAQLIGTYRTASPQGRWVLLRGDYGLKEKQQSVYQMYDAEQDTLRTLAPPPGAEMEGAWTGDSHLPVRTGPEHKRQQMDVVTGQITPLNKNADDNSAASRLFPDLTVFTDPETQRDSSRSGAFDSTRLWVCCVPRLKQPLSAAGAGLTMSADDPQAVWSPTGRQIAYLNNGDLCVTDVAPVDAAEPLGNEKYTLGLPLTCPEERDVAISKLKQIGLALVQYTQDNDEKFPPAEGIDGTLLPFLKDRSAVSIGSVHWVYHAPADLSYAAMDAPANVVLGTMDLPCGRLSLMADGHVKSLKAQEKPPSPQ